MRKRFTGSIIGVVLASAVFVAPASAATEFGDGCIANRATGEGVKATLFSITSVSSPLPDAAPSAGVITSWRLSLISPPEGSIPPIVPQTLKVFRLNPAIKTAQVVGEASGLVGSGTNTIPARISVQPGDRLGVYGEGPITLEGSTGEVGTLFCEEGLPGDVVGAFTGTAPTGGTAAYEEGNELRVSAVALLEPDADNDGFGDETQDKCPQIATVQTPCPVVAVDASSVIKRKGSVVVLVTADSAAPVKITGTAKLGKGKKAKLSSKTLTVVPGKVTRFTVNYPRKLKKKLKALKRSKSLQLTLTASATDLIGRVTTDRLKTRLKGQAKAAKK